MNLQTTDLIALARHTHPTTRRRLSFATLFGLFAAAAAPAQTVTLDAVGRGTIEGNDAHVSSYSSGGFVNPYAIGIGGNGTPETRTRSFFVFELPQAPAGQQVGAATLRLFVPNDINSIQGAPIEGHVHDVDAPVSALEDGSALFEDLGDGDLFGSREYVDADENTFTEITLTAAGVASVNAALGSPYALSMRTPSEDMNDQNYFIFANSGTLNDTQDGNSQLVITWAPDEPTSYCDPANGNSVSAGGAVLMSTGGFGTSAADFTIAGIPDQWGVLYTGANDPGALPFGCGLRCVSGSEVRYGPFLPSGNALAVTIDMSTSSNTRVQYWYRDPANAGACGDTFNLSNALVQ